MKTVEEKIDSIRQYMDAMIAELTPEKIAKKP